MSGAAPLEHAVELGGRAEHLDAVDAAAAQARVVVDEADDALARGLAQLAHQAPAGPAGADDQRPPRRAVAQRDRVPISEPLGEPRAADRDHADQRVDDEEGGLKSRMFCVSTMNDEGDGLATTTAAAAAIASRMPAKRQTDR